MVPSVSAISPASGPTGGRRLVQIMGQGFQLPPEPPAQGIAPKPNPSVEVLFGTSPGSDVAVASDSRLFVVTPKSPLPASAPTGAVDVVVRNVDQSGNVIPGETVTVANGYTYARPDINAQPEADLTRLVRTLIRELRRQVLDEVTLTVHTDYSDEPGSGLAAIAEVPSLVLSGPDLRENRFFSVNQPREASNTFGLGTKFYERLRPPYTVDLIWAIIGVTTSTIQNLNLQQEVQAFFHRNKVLTMAADPSDPAAGDVSYEMDLVFGGEMSAVGTPNNSNVRAFRGQFLIRGFDVDDASMGVLLTRELEDQLPAGSVVSPSAISLDLIQQLGIVYRVGPSPGGN